jgi:formate dehydrogenase subunit delta
MDVHKLVSMANQIGSFFAAMPDHEEGVAGIAAHIQRSWDPRMRRQLLEHVSADGDHALMPIVREAIARVRG